MGRACNVFIRPAGGESTTMEGLLALETINFALALFIHYLYRQQFPIRFMALVTSDYFITCGPVYCLK